MERNLLHVHYSAIVPYKKILTVLKRKFADKVEINERDHLKFVEKQTKLVDFDYVQSIVDKNDWSKSAALFYHIIKSKIFFPFYHLLILKELDIQKIKNIEFRIRLGSFRDISIEEELKMFHTIREVLWKDTDHDFCIIVQGCKTDKKDILIPYFHEINNLYKKHKFVRDIVHSYDLACNEEYGKPLKDLQFIHKFMVIPPIFHAGEHGPLEKIISNMYFAIEKKCKRIGHGIYSAKDPKLLALLKKQNVCLELCPWSNIYLNATKTKSELIEMYEIIVNSGVPYCINTDDPNKLKNKTMEDNYEWCERNIEGFDRSFANLNSIKFSTINK
jgi:adenosine deaminase